MIIGQDENKSIITKAVEVDVPCLLIGETGTGKTSLIREIAKENGNELIRINLTGQTSTDEFLGKWLIKDGATYWQDGALVQAMKEGQWLVIDEINVALPEILFALHSLLDDDRAVMLSEKDGEIVRPAKNFRLFATMNPTTEYAGTKELNKAFLSRFSVVVWFEYPTPKDEVKILEQYIDKDTAGPIVDVATKIRQHKNNDAIFYTCSTRDLIQWAMLSKPLGIENSFRATILNKAMADADLLLASYNESFEPIQNKLKEYKSESVKELLKKIDKAEKDLQKTKKETEQAIKDLETRKENIVKELVEFQATKKAERVKNGK